MCASASAPQARPAALCITLSFSLSPPPTPCAPTCPRVAVMSTTVCPPPPAPPQLRAHMAPPDRDEYDRVTFLEQLYTRPSQLDDICNPYWGLDLGMLFMWGGVFRLATALVIYIKVCMKATR